MNPWNEGLPIPPWLLFRGYLCKHDLVSEVCEEWRKEIEEDEWYKPKDCTDDEVTCSAKKGYLDRLKTINETRKIEWTDTLVSHIIENGRLECLKYAHENGCWWDMWTCRIAAKRGQLDCLKYLHENGCEWNEGTCNAAVWNGHLECLKYAHENGCPWYDGICNGAALYGYLDCLIYAHENGCEWGIETCNFAART
jgi:hypothetical protein